MQGMDSDLIALLTSLVAVDSVNPSLVPGGAGEGRDRGLVEGWAREHGLETERLEETPGRPSVLVRARGTGGGRTLLLCGHTDVVNVEGMTDPFTPRIEGDRMYGRGTYDMKAGLAAALIAARDASRLGWRATWWSPRWPTRSTPASAFKRRCATSRPTPPSSPSRPSSS